MLNVLALFFYLKTKKKHVFSVISPSHQKVKTSSPSLSTRSNVVNKNNNNTSSNNNLSEAIANRSSLFKNSPQQIAAAPSPPTQKINHGKPNLAPRPPPQLSLAISNNSSISGGFNSNSSLNNSVNNIDGNRKNSVARHQSMKSPRYFLSFLDLNINCLICPCLFVLHV